VAGFSAKQARSFTFVFLFLYFGLFFNCLFVAAVVAQAGISYSANASGKYESYHKFFHTEWFYTEKLRPFCNTRQIFRQMVVIEG
jgi:hypothetical protein